VSLLTEANDYRPSRVPLPGVAISLEVNMIYMTYHFMWVLNMPGGEKDNYEESDILYRDVGRRAFTKDNHYTIIGPSRRWPSLIVRMKK
jgi:hypothetical protein